jgi:imidazolonepropionase-like amidohydrolase
VIVVKDERTRDVGTPVPPAQLIDPGRSSVLPGLIDTHTRILLNGDITDAD